jgi:hypothetical protein
MKTRMMRLPLCAALLGAGVLLASGDAAAKQCVFNKGGYVLKVRWFRPADLKVEMPGQTFAGAPRLGLATPSARPIQEDTLTAGFGACTKTDEVLTALFSVPGCVYAQIGSGGWRRCPGRTVYCHPYRAGVYASRQSIPRLLGRYRRREVGARRANLGLDRLRPFGAPRFVAGLRSDRTRAGCGRWTRE